MISIPATDTLLPRWHTLPDGTRMPYFHSSGTEMLKLDIVSEAGSAYQPQLLCAAAANRLHTVASAEMDAAQVAEFMDYRGVVVEHNPDVLTATTTFYCLRRHFAELLPVVQRLLVAPAFPQADFDSYMQRRRHELMATRQKSVDMARRIFYQSLFGPNHPLGIYADPEAADRLQRQTVADYFAQRYAQRGVVLAGNVDDELLDAAAALVAHGTVGQQRIESLASDVSRPAQSQVECPIPGAVQTTVRVGRLLPFAWDDPDYADFMLLVTLLGGYFGSRLMGNLREDKGYTYGVAARTQIYRGTIVFYITADVAAGTAADSMEQIRLELRRLVDNPVSDDELQMVCNVMAGDFIRSVDGVFERSERFIQMQATDVDERLTDNLRAALTTVTPARLQQLARRLLDPDAMLYCRAGA